VTNSLSISKTIVELNLPYTTNAHPLSFNPNNTVANLAMVSPSKNTSPFRKLNHWRTIIFGLIATLSTHQKKIIPIESRPLPLKKNLISARVFQKRNKTKRR
jgi:hypothetical protein